MLLSRLSTHISQSIWCIVILHLQVATASKVPTHITPCYCFCDDSRAGQTEVKYDLHWSRWSRVQELERLNCHHAEQTRCLKSVHFKMSLFVLLKVFLKLGCNVKGATWEYVLSVVSWLMLQKSQRLSFDQWAQVKNLLHFKLVTIPLSQPCMTIVTRLVSYVTMLKHILYLVYRIPQLGWWQL